MGAYSQSKLAVALFAGELDRRLRAVGATVTSVLAHPGWSATAVARPDDHPGPTVRFSRRATAILGTSPRSGARSEVYAATAPGIDGGSLIGPRLLAWGSPRAVALPRAAADPDAARWLWSESVRLTGAEPRPV
jgi:NAD(P)-dependent dehydrogenase (short-subunit alcohol dehydrogenase family)